MKLTKIVDDVIRLGDASRDYWEGELRKHHPDYPIVHEGEFEVPPSPEDALIQQLLAGLTDEQLYLVLWLAYVGRGDYRSDDLSGGYHDLKATFPQRDVAIAQLASNKFLAEYLKDAIDDLQRHKIEVDRLALQDLLQSN